MLIKLNLYYTHMYIIYMNSLHHEDHTCFMQIHLHIFVYSEICTHSLPYFALLIRLLRARSSVIYEKIAKNSYSEASTWKRLRDQDICTFIWHIFSNFRQKNRRFICEISQIMVIFVRATLKFHLITFNKKK